jgi:phosphotransferase system enzyme I (PtsP)
MLKTLRRIVQDVSSAQNLPQALSILVQKVAMATQIQAVAVYLIDNINAEYVLMAVSGLNEQAIGKVRLSLDQGLIGLVGRREEPINLNNAQEHQDFFQHKLVGEEDMKAFLGVPIIHHRRLYGVLTLQQEDGRKFDESEEAFLVTLAAQLGGIIAHSEATGELAAIVRNEVDDQLAEIDDASFGGIGSVPGVGIGTVVVVYPPAEIDAVPNRAIEDIDAEVELFREALQETREEIAKMAKRLAKMLPTEENSLFDAYLKILDKDALGLEVESVITEEKVWAQWALAHVIKRYIAQFEQMEDPYLRERASDFRDLGRRVLACLQASQMEQIDYPKRTILVGDEVTAAALADVPEGYLKGLVSARGSSNSHVAILARALGVPTVMGAKGLNVDKLNRRAMIVDGYFGQVYVSPSRTLLAEFKRLAAEENELNQSLDELRDKPAQTQDNYRIALYVNTGLAMDASLSLSVGGEGVGLYRSEVPFITRDRFPSEEEQRVIYKQTLKAFAPLKVTMRTLDIGGDKVLPYFPIEEENPFLGWRGIRITLDHPDVFLMQIRAMLKANQGLDNLRIMLPMISGVGEVDEALHLIDQAYQEVLEEFGEVSKPDVGIMIEVPSAVYQARSLASRVDFLSVGSNDLTQYLLAVDRNNPRVAGLYDSLHPAVLRSLMQVVEGGHSEGIPVSICGEMASDPVAVILLIAMGFDALSMNSSSLPRVKWVVRQFSMSAARKILGEVLEMDNPALIRFHLEKALDLAGLGGLIRAGKA